MLGFSWHSQLLFQHLALNMAHAIFYYHLFCLNNCVAPTAFSLLPFHCNIHYIWKCRLHHARAFSHTLQWSLLMQSLYPFFSETSLCFHILSGIPVEAVDTMLSTSCCVLPISFPTLHILNSLSHPIFWTYCIVKTAFASLSFIFVSKLAFCTISFTVFICMLIVSSHECEFPEVRK